MIFPGHVAAAYLASKLFRTDQRAGLAVSMFPDMIDKPVRWLLHITPNDRIPAHTGLVWTLTSAITWLLGGKRFAQGWLVGYGAHLVCDEINAYLNPGRIYFWWPFKRYQMHTGPTGLQSSLNDFSPASLLVEAVTVVCALWVWRRSQNKGQRSPRIA